jgi:hypothetical protein
MLGAMHPIPSPTQQSPALSDSLGHTLLTED